MLPLLSTRSGGPVSFAAEAAAFLPSIGVRPTLFATDLAHIPRMIRAERARANELPEEFPLLDAELFETRQPHRFAYSPALRSRLRESLSKYDLVHIHSVWLYPQYAAYQEARRSEVPYIVSPHGAFDPFLRRRGRLRKALTTALWQNQMLEHASAIHLVAEQEAALMQDLAPSVPRSVIPCGIRVAAFQNLPKDNRFRDHELGGHSGPVVLFLGRITFKKGLDILIRAFGRARMEVPDAHLAVVGPDDEGLVGGLRALAAEIGVDDAVSFTGPLYRSERLHALAAADVWALPSHSEALPIAVLEALAAGVPTVLSPGINVAHEIVRADAGVVADITPVAFGDALTSILADPRRREALSTNGRNFASRYDWSAVAPMLARLYSDVAGTR